MKNNITTTLLSRWTHVPLVLQGFFFMLFIAALLIPSTALSQWSVDPTINNLISNASQDQVTTASVSDGNNGAIIAWADMRDSATNGGTYDIYAQRVNASGTVQWTPNGVAICTMDSDQVSPSIISDGNGGAIIAWHDKRSGEFDIYSQRVNSSGVLQWIPLTGNPVVVVVFDQVNMAMASDGNGGALLTWEDYRANTGPGLADIYIQKVSSTGVPQWTANGIGVCTNAFAQFAPRIISDENGGAFLTWYDQRSGGYDIYAQGVATGGGMVATAGGVAVCTFASDQINPDICSDGAGGSIIVWQDARSTTDQDIWVQRMGPAVSIVWGVDGVVMNNNVAFDQINPKIVSDGVGGAMMAWQDFRTGVTSDIYAQRVNSAGTVATGWNPNGVAVCVSNGNQSNPQIVSDGSSGEIITWTDKRDSTTNGGVSDIYASRITEAFALPWTANGVAIGTADSTQSNPSIVTDGNGGAIIAWQDNRQGNYDIYTTRVNPVAAPPVTYTITATAGSNGSLSPSGSVSVNENSSQQFTFSANTGYHVDSVYVNGVFIDSTVSYTFSNVITNHTIHVTFAINTYIITASAGANGSISPSGSVGVNYNASQSFTITPNIGYLIADVLVNGNSVGAVSSYTFDTVKVNQTISASFTIKTYTLNITVLNGTVTKNPDLAQYDSNATVQLTAMPNSGYHFVNWSGDASGSTNPLNVTMDASKNITANFAIDTYSLTVLATNGSVAKNPDQISYDSNSTVQLTATPGVGYHFTGWSGDASGITNPLDVTMDANKTITANFAIDTYTLTLLATNGTVTKNPDQATYDSNSTVQLTATPGIGYHFTGWSGDASGSTNPLTVTMNADKNITANFAIDTYTLTVLATNGSVTKNPDQATYDSNSTVELTATPGVGYHFTGWSGDATGTTNPLTVTMDANKNITANFSINTYTLSILAVNGNVLKNPDQVSYDSNTTVELTATPVTGYHFTGWSVDASGMTNPLLVIMDADKDIRANFGINSYVITATSGTNGTISPSGSDTLDYGSNEQFTFTPSTGYHVDIVTVDGVSVDSITTYTFLNVTMNHTIHVTFAINTFAITATAGLNGSISPAGSVSVNYGADRQFAITPNAGYRIDSIVVDNVRVDSMASYTFYNVTEGHTIHATFEFIVVYRSFMPESLANDKDHKGKFGLFVNKKPNKVQFALFAVSIYPNVNTLHMEFSLSLDTTYDIYTVPASTVTTTDPRLKKWDFKFDSNLAVGDTIRVYAYGANGFRQQVTSYTWRLNGVFVGKKLNRPTFIYSIPRLPMPNRINVLNETFLQQGYNVVKNGLQVGVTRLDSPKVYGWVIHRKYTEVLRSLSIRRGSVVNYQDGTPRGFDFFTTGRPFVGIQTTLLPTKQDNALFGNLIGLKFSIVASALQITPVGFGELILQDTLSNPFNGMTLRQIVDKADSLMSGNPGRVFADPATYALLNSTIARILAGFEGAMDTISFSTGLVVRGAKPLSGVSILMANPTAIPQVITPTFTSNIAEQFALEQNYPNPFNPTTTIEFNLPFASTVTVKIFNLLGQEVATLINNQQMGDGMQAVEFSAANYASGVYLYRITAETVNDEGIASTFTSVKKMMLMK